MKRKAKGDSALTISEQVDAELGREEADVSDVSDVSDVAPPDPTGVIITEQFHTFPGTCMTVCCLTLKNGFAVIGEASCVDPQDFSQRLGRASARMNAIDMVLMLDGYLRKERMHLASRGLELE